MRAQLFPGASGGKIDGAEDRMMWAAFNKLLNGQLPELCEMYAAADLPNENIERLAEAVKWGDENTPVSICAALPSSDPTTRAKALTVTLNDIIKKTGRALLSATVDPLGSGDGHATAVTFRKGDNDSWIVALHNLGYGAHGGGIGRGLPCAYVVRLPSAGELLKLIESLAILQAKKASMAVAGRFYESFATDELLNLSELTSAQLANSDPPQTFPSEKTIRVERMPLYGARAFMPAQISGNCTYASKDALMRYNLLFLDNGVADGEEMDRKIGTLDFFFAAQMLKAQVDELEKANTTDSNYYAAANIALCMLNECTVKFNNFCKWIVLDEYRKKCQKDFHGLRDRVLRVAGMAPAATTAIAAPTVSIDLAPHLPSVPDLAASAPVDDVLLPTTAMTEVGQAFVAVDKAIEALSDEDNTSSDKWQAVFSVLKLFNDDVFSLGDARKDEAFADALLNMFLHELLPLADFATILDEQYDTDELERICLNIANASKFLSLRLDPVFRCYSVKQENCFLTLQGAYVVCFKAILGKRQATLKSRYSHYKPFDISSIGISVHQVNIYADCSVSTKDMRRRKLLLANWGVSEGGIALNCRQQKDAIKGFFESVDTSVASLLSGPTTTTAFGEAQTAAAELNRANENARKASEGILERMLALRKLISQADEKNNYIATISDFLSNIEVEQADIGKIIESSKAKMRRLEQIETDASEAWKKAKRKRETHTKEQLDVAQKKMQDADAALQKHQRIALDWASDERKLDGLIKTDRQRLNSELKRIGGKIKKLEEDLENARTEVEAKKQPFENLKKQFDAAEKQFNDAQNDVAKTGKTLRAAMATTKGADTTYQDAQHQLTLFMNAQSKAKSKTAEDDRRKIELTESVKKAEKAANEARKKEAEAAAANELALRARDTARAALEPARSALIGPQKQFDDAEKKRSFAENNLETAMAERETLQRQLEGIDEDIADTRTRIKDFRKADGVLPSDTVDSWTQRVEPQLQERYIESWNKYNDALRENNELCEVERQKQQDYNDAATAVADMQNFIKGLEAKSQELIALKEKTNEMLIEVRTWADVGSADYRGWEKERDDLLEDYMLSMERIYVCDALGGEFFDLKSSVVDSCANETGAVIIGTAHRVQNSTTTANPKTPLETYFQTGRDAAQKKYLEEIRIDKLSGTVAHARNQTIEYGKNKYVSTLHDRFVGSCANNSLEIGTFGRLPGSNLPTSTIEAAPHTDLTNATKACIAFDSLSDPQAIATISSVFARGKTNYTVQTTSVQSVLTNVQKNANTVAYNFLDLTGTRGNFSNSIAEVVNCNTSNCIPFCSPHALVGAGDYAGHLAVIDSISACMFGERKSVDAKKASLSKPITGDGFASSVWESSPGDLHQHLRQTDFGGLFKDSQVEVATQDDTSDGRRAAHDILFDLLESGNDVRTLLKKSSYTDGRNPTILLRNILTLLQDNMSILQLRPQVFLDLIQRDIPSVLMTQRTANETASLSPEDIDSFLASLKTFIVDTIKGGIITDKDNKIICRFASETIHFLREITPIIGAIVTLCAQAPDRNADCRKPFVDGCFAIADALIPFLTLNMDLEDAGTLDGKRAIAEILPQVCGDTTKFLERPSLYLHFLMAPLKFFQMPLSMRFGGGGLMGRHAWEKIALQFEFVRLQLSECPDGYCVTSTVNLWERADHPLISSVSEYKQQKELWGEIDGRGYRFPAREDDALAERRYTFNPSEQTVLNKAGEVVFSMFDGVGAFAAPKPGTAGRKVRVGDVLNDMPDRQKMDLLSFFGIHETSEVVLTEDENTRTCKLTDGPFADEIFTVKTRNVAGAVASETDIWFKGWVVRQFQDVKNNFSKVLGRGITLAKRDGNKTILRVFSPKPAGDSKRDFESPDFIIDLSKDGAVAAKYRNEDATYSDAQFCKMPDIGIDMPALHKFDCICLSDQPGPVKKIIVPDVCINGRPLTFIKRDTWYEVAGFPGLRVATESDIKQVQDVCKGATCELIPFIPFSVLTLVPLDGTISPGTPLRFFSMPVTEVNSQLYTIEDCQFGLPERNPKVGGVLGAFGSDARIVRAAKNDMKQVELQAFECKNGVISPTDTVSSLHEVCQRLTVIHALLLNKKYDSAVTVARDVRVGLVLPRGKDGDHIRRIFTEIVFSFRDLGPEATALKLAIFDIWTHLEADRSSIFSYYARELPKKGYMRFKGGAQTKALKSAMHCLWTSIEQNIDSPVLVETLGSKLGIPKDEVCTIIDSIRETFVAPSPPGVDPELTDALAKNWTVWSSHRHDKIKARFASVQNWPEVTERRKFGDDKLPDWPSECGELLAMMNSALSHRATRFGEHNAPLGDVPQIPVNSADDPAVQAALSRMNAEFSAGADSIAYDMRFVPQELSVTQADKEFAHSMEALIPKITVIQARALDAIKAAIAENYSGKAIDPLSAIRCMLLTRPKPDGDLCVLGPTHFCAELRMRRESYEKTMNSCRAYALAAMLLRGCDDIRSYMRTLISSKNDAEKSATWIKVNQYTERIREVCGPKQLGPVGRGLGAAIHVDVLMAFSMDQGIIPTPEQVKLLSELITRKCSTVKLMMGGGKSSVISALLAVAQASREDTTRLTVIAAHKSQVTNAASFWRGSERKMGQKVTVCNPTRSDFQSTGYLVSLLQELEDLRRKAGVLCVETGFFPKIELEIVETLSSKARLADLYKAANDVAAKFAKIDAQLRKLQQSSSKIASSDRSRVLAVLNKALIVNAHELTRIKQEIAKIEGEIGAEERFVALVKLRKFFQEEAFVILDEVHLSASPKEEVNYPSGRRQTVSATLNRNFAHFFKLLAEFNRTKGYNENGGVFGLANNTQGQKTNAEFEADKDNFVRHLYTCDLIPGHKMSTFLGKFEISFVNFVDIMMGKIDADTYIAVIQQSELDEDRELLEAFMSLRAAFLQLETCRHSEINRHAGLHKRPGSKFAESIPFLASMIPSMNNFANPFEQLFNGYRQVFIKDMSYCKHFLPDFLEVFSEKVGEEISIEVLTTDQDMPASRFFYAVVGVSYDEFSRAFRLKDSNAARFEEIMERITEHLAANDLARLTVYEYYSAVSNRYNPAMKTAGCTSLVASFKDPETEEFFGMGCTGTLSTTKILPRVLQKGTGDMGIEGQIFSKALRDFTSGQTAIKIVETDPEPDISSLYESVPTERRGLVRLIVDRGGLFKVKDIKTILPQYAAELNKYNAGVKWIIYEDPVLGFCAYDIVGFGRDTKYLTGVTRRDLINAGLTPDICAAYYSERLATGTDGVFIPNAYGITTINPCTNTPEQLAQAIMRFRQYQIGQKMCFAVGACPQVGTLTRLSARDLFLELLALMARNEAEDNKKGIIQATMNEIIAMYKWIFMDAVLNADYRTAQVLREQFEFLLVRNLSLDVVTAFARRQTEQSGNAIVTAFAHDLNQKFAGALRGLEGFPYYDTIQRKFHKLIHLPDPSIPNDLGGELHRYLSDMRPVLDGFKFQSSGSSQFGAGTELEQQTETEVQITVDLTLDVQNQTENQLEQQSQLCTMTQIQSEKANQALPRISLHLENGINPNVVTPVSTSMIGFQSAEGKYPHPAQSIFRGLCISPNLVNVFSGREVRWPFNDIGIMGYVAIDAQGTVCIVSDFDVAEYMQHGNSWQRGMPVIFDPLGCCIYGEADSLPEGGDQRYAVALFTGQPHKIPSRWFKEKFGVPDGQSTVNSSAVTAYVYMCNTEDEHRKRNNIKPMDSRERAEFAHLIFPSKGGVSVSAAAGHMEMAPGMTRTITTGAGMDPTDIDSIVIALSKPDALTHIQADIVRRIPARTLNALPCETCGRLFALFSEHISVADLDPLHLLVFDLISQRDIVDCTPEEAIQFFTYARALRSFLAKGTSGETMLASIRDAMTSRLVSIGEEITAATCRIFDSAVKIYTYLPTQALRLSANLQAEHRKAFSEKFRSCLSLNLRRIDVGNVSIGAFREIMAISITEAYDLCAIKCSEGELSALRESCFTLFNQLCAKEVNAMFCHMRNTAENIGRLGYEFTARRRVMAAFAWILAIIFCGLPLALRSRIPSLDSIYAVHVIRPFAPAAIMHFLSLPGNNAIAEALLRTVNEKQEKQANLPENEQIENLKKFVQFSPDAPEQTVSLKSFQDDADIYAQLCDAINEAFDKSRGDIKSFTSMILHASTEFDTLVQKAAQTSETSGEFTHVAA
ncbi:MAG: hypothetical protein LBD72_01795 [Puniceicoccales bacterium]|jgi:hypothetical protein|nr:hypothetical protein [Puniceicoccales bacterium]